MTDGEQLGRIALKKAVVRPDLTPDQAWVMAPPGGASRPVALLESAGFEVRVSQDPAGIIAGFQDGQADVLLLSDACPQPQLKDLATAIRASDSGPYVALVLYATGQTDGRSSAVMAYALDTDAMVSAHDAPDVFKATVKQSCAERAPLHRLGILPAELANRIDTVCSRMDDLDHFALLGVPHDVDREQLREKFHALALELHPDRHTALKTIHPPGFTRVKRVYKRMAEAYQVLSNDDLRQKYRLGLGQDGTNQTQRSASGRLMKELAMCETESGRKAVMESIEARNFGDWDEAEAAMVRATASEPENQSLGRVLDTIRKLKGLIEH